MFVRAIQKKDAGPRTRESLVRRHDGCQQLERVLARAVRRRWRAWRSCLGAVAVLPVILEARAGGDHARPARCSKFTNEREARVEPVVVLDRRYPLARCDVPREVKEMG